MQMFVVSRVLPHVTFHNAPFPMLVIVFYRVKAIRAAPEAVNQALTDMRGRAAC